MKVEILTSLSILFSIAAVCFLAFIGWYIVWTFVLSQFRFIRELFRSGSENSSVTELKTARSKTKRLRKE
ncbi:hypothetical protein Zmor_006535 [Zophobas morio]|uniref:Small integral membrane protein 13 n=1 Tax=Zophobas morio TaxID=2755281 RepID=A0AA38IRU6_9CUCU|nr:hypothetical protein Zmor_004579 [Zophobas morio]KAJ3662179.1 hypothetical protein Zmor_006535 [Zophobas morio]